MYTLYDIIHKKFWKMQIHVEWEKSDACPEGRRGGQAEIWGPTGHPGTFGDGEYARSLERGDGFMSVYTWVQ